MMKDRKESATEHLEDEEIGQQAVRPSGQDRQEQYQRTREHAASGQHEQDREARIRRRAREIWEREGQLEGFAEQHWERAVQDLDREDAEGQREGTGGKDAGAGTAPGLETKKGGSDRT